MSDIYTQNGRVRGKCSVCGDTKTYKQSKRPQYFKPYYFRVLEKVNWFRGDDEYLGMVCKQCIKAGRVSEVNKLHANTATLAQASPESAIRSEEQ